MRAACTICFLFNTFKDRITNMSAFERMKMYRSDGIDYMRCVYAPSNNCNHHSVSDGLLKVDGELLSIEESNS